MMTHMMPKSWRKFTRGSLRQLYPLYLPYLVYSHAPPSVLNVLPGQPVELRVAKRTTEDYVPPRGTGFFTGSGNRLGAPVPTFTESGGTSSSMPGSFPSTSSIVSTAAAAAPAPDRENISTRFEVDQTLPTTSVQIRLADGTRMVCRMNYTHTVQDLRNFINACVFSSSFVVDLISREHRPGRVRRISLVRIRLAPHSRTAHLMITLSQSRMRGWRIAL